MSSSKRRSKRPSGITGRSAQRAGATPARRTTAKRTAASARQTAAATQEPAARSRPAAPAPAPTSPSRPSIRLPGAPSSRLTSKPGAPDRSAKLRLSTKPRSSGPRPLSDVKLDDDEVLIDAFDATLDGIRVRITAVLERTCVYLDRDGDRRLARKNDLWVEADKLPIRRRGIG